MSFRAHEFGASLTSTPNAEEAASTRIFGFLKSNEIAIGKNVFKELRFQQRYTIKNKRCREKLSFFLNRGSYIILKN